MVTTSRPRPLPKAERDEPESLAQAHRWQAVLTRYLRLGLCHACAAHLAWGHQLGFTRLEGAPCATCQPILAGFPSRTVNGWRYLPRGQEAGDPPGSLPGPRRAEAGDRSEVQVFPA